MSIPIPDGPMLSLSDPPASDFTDTDMRAWAVEQLFHTPDFKFWMIIDNPEAVETGLHRLTAYLRTGRLVPRDGVSNPAGPGLEHGPGGPNVNQGLFW